MRLQYQNYLPNTHPKLLANFDVVITSPLVGATVKVGELTISGISTDTANTDCQVYASWNSERPYQLVTPKSKDDYSKWTFTYTDEYNLITEGDTNDLTAKLSLMIVVVVVVVVPAHQILHMILLVS